MEIEAKKLEDALRRILDVERNHLYGAKTGSQSARKNEVERELDRVLVALLPPDAASPEST
jgi:hypothetical protein